MSGLNSNIKFARYMRGSLPEPTTLQRLKKQPIKTRDQHSILGENWGIYGIQGGWKENDFACNQAILWSYWLGPWIKSLVGGAYFDPVCVYKERLPLTNSSHSLLSSLSLPLELVTKRVYIYFHIRIDLLSSQTSLPI